MASETIRYRTRRMLADALMEVMRGKQLDEITIADIVRACDVSRKAFYYHFEDIYDLANWTLQEEWKEMRPVSNEELNTSLETLIDYLQQNRSFCPIHYEFVTKIQDRKPVYGSYHGCDQSETWRAWIV